MSSPAAGAAGCLGDRLAAGLYPLDTPIHEMAVAGARLASAGRPRPAAVLVGVTDCSEPQVLLTVRSNRLKHHAGQVAFPGGRREAGDASVVETALRETREETGIPEQAVRPLGFLGRYDTVTGYRITAVVGLVRDGLEPVPDRREIEAVFSVPLAHVADPGRYRSRTIEFGGQRFEVLTLAHDRHYIWGATAALLHRFAGLIGRNAAGG